MSECHHYGCKNIPNVTLKAWGPGKVRDFCEEHAEIRSGLSGYTEVTNE